MGRTAYEVEASWLALASLVEECEAASLSEIGKPKGHRGNSARRARARVKSGRLAEIARGLAPDADVTPDELALSFPFENTMPGKKEH
jgi:hypothetical protein